MSTLTRSSDDAFFVEVGGMEMECFTSVKPGLPASYSRGERPVEPSEGYQVDMWFKLPSGHVMTAEDAVTNWGESFVRDCEQKAIDRYEE